MYANCLLETDLGGPEGLTAHVVCVGNCGRSAKPYYAEHTWRRSCGRGSLIKKQYTEGCGPGDAACALGYCAARCNDEPKCGEFVVSEGLEQCGLHTACDYIESADGTRGSQYFGTFRLGA